MPFAFSGVPREDLLFCRRSGPAGRQMDVRNGNKAVRIGIYTQPLRLNYGGILQAWALQTLLLRKGFDAVTLDTVPDCRLPPWKKPYSYGKRVARKLLGGGGYIFFEDVWNRSYGEASKNIRPFVETRIRRRVVRNVREIGEDEFDVLLAGSDQVWRPCYNSGRFFSIGHSFFDFARDWNVKRVAYAASFGTDDWEFTPRQTRKCAALAKKFVAVGVREKSGVALCREYLGVNAVQVPDPTLLLERADYEALIEASGNTVRPEGNLLCYFMDDSAQSGELVRAAAVRRGFNPFRVPMWHGRVEERVCQPSVEQWLRYFRDAEAVATDSFHACVFSLIFGKPFVVLGNAARGLSRYESLLGELGFEGCLVSTPEEGVDALHRGVEFQDGRISRWLSEKRRLADAFLGVLA